MTAVAPVRPARADRLLAVVLAAMTLALVLRADATPVAAQTPVPAQAKATAAFRAWIETLWPEARAVGVSRPTFDRAFAGVTPDLKLPDLARRRIGPRSGQAEFDKTPAEYLSERTLAQLTARGRRFLAEHRQLLEAIERRMGVDRHIILAIFGRETAYGGKATGYGTFEPRHHAIRVLATQAYLGRRKDLFRKELILALKMVQEGHVRLDAMRSSWAGAMGLGQFMPSNFYAHGVDFDGDGKRDIWRSLGDSLATTAKSLTDQGWKAGRRWGYEMRAPARLDCRLEGPDQARPLADWLKLGFRRADGRSFTADERAMPTYLLMPAGGQGPAFLLHNNFLVLKTYNFADLYALFVGHLADRIAGGKGFVQPWKRLVQLNTAETAEMQRLLGRLGYDIGKIDGKAGVRTRTIVGAYQQAHGLSRDCWPSAAVLGHLRQKVAASR
ncbi:MAG: lytic murein transglycosylase [Hyphomicrobiaceae bacterium]